MSSLKSIVFGPTGRVGSAAARSAVQHGSQVVLAMRDTKKSIPGLSPEQERDGGYERVEADLTNSESVEEAVKKTSAKRAFIYVSFASQDYMKSTIAALKSAGIEFVVLLSSWSVEGDLTAISPSDMVPWIHAQVELGLREAFGQDGYAAVRPAWFASNALWYQKQIPSGDVKLAFPELTIDWISPEDIGAVSGALLARGSVVPGSTQEPSVLYLMGPEELSQRDAIGIIAKAINKEIKVTQVGQEEALEVFVKTTELPEPLAKTLLDTQKIMNEVEGSPFAGPRYEVAVSNIERHLARKPARFHEWVEQNKKEFLI